MSPSWPNRTSIVNEMVVGAISSRRNELFLFTRSGTRFSKIKSYIEIPHSITNVSNYDKKWSVNVVGSLCQRCYMQDTRDAGKYCRERNQGKNSVKSLHILFSAYLRTIGKRNTTVPSISLVLRNITFYHVIMCRIRRNIRCNLFRYETSMTRNAFEVKDRYRRHLKITPSCVAHIIFNKYILLPKWMW